MHRSAGRQSQRLMALALLYRLLVEQEAEAELVQVRCEQHLRHLALQMAALAGLAAARLVQMKLLAAVNSAERCSGLQRIPLLVRC